jgi:hypothetical protein
MTGGIQYRSKRWRWRDSYVAWLAQNPPPALPADFTIEQWAEYDVAMSAWQQEEHRRRRPWETREWDDD